MIEMRLEPEAQPVRPRASGGLVALSPAASPATTKSPPIPRNFRSDLALAGRPEGAKDVVRAASLLGLRSRIIRNVSAQRLGAIPPIRRYWSGRTASGRF